MGPFWPPFWGRFRLFWRPSSAKFGPKPVWKACQLQKRDFSPNTRPRVRERKFQSQDGLQNAPRSAQDGSKRLLKTNFFAVENRLKFGVVLAPILVDFGSRNAPLWAPFWRPKSIKKSCLNWTAQNADPRSPQDRPRPPQDPPKSAPRPPKTTPRPPKSSLRDPQDPPKCPQEPPRSPQDSPRYSQETHKSSQETVTFLLDGFVCMMHE